MKNIVIFGATGSIGIQTLEVLSMTDMEYQLIGLTANRNTESLLKIVKKHQPKYYACNSSIEKQIGKSRLVKSDYLLFETEFNIALIAIVGSSALTILAQCLKMSKIVLLANKESIVMAGEYLMPLAKKYKAKIIPIDSEASAIWQCLEGSSSIPKKYFITASGGTFYSRNWSELRNVTVEQATKHPNWNMGKKITLDSSTMVNKAFEVAEVKWLFGTNYSEISVLLHRQSIIHGMIQFTDGNVKALLSAPSMTYSIRKALHYDMKTISEQEISYYQWNPEQISELTFEEIEQANYPCFFAVLKLLKQGGVFPALANAAIEAAGFLFFNKMIKYTEILDIIDYTVDNVQSEKVTDWQQLYQFYNKAYKVALRWCDRR